MKISLLLLLLIPFSGFGQVPKGKIIFASAPGNDSKYMQLFIINSDGSGERQLTNTSKVSDLPGIFRNRIVYRQTEGNDRDASILVMGMDGGIVNPLIEHKFVCYPKWKPDGKQIAYEYYPDKTPEIWVMDSNGKNKHILLTNARHPNWSQNNQELLFTRDYEIYILNLKRGTQKRITNLAPKNIQAKWPAISPDGKKIAFVAFYGDNPRKTGTFIIDVGKNGDPQILENCTMPCWTDDPKYLVCSYIRNKEQQIVMINVETEEKIFITDKKRMNDFPVWVNQ